MHPENDNLGTGVGPSFKGDFDDGDTWKQHK